MPHRAIVQRLLLGAAVLLAGCTTPSDPAMTDRLDALMHDYAGNVPGCLGAGDARRQGHRAPQLRLRRPRSEVAATPASQLPPGIDQQAVHSAAILLLAQDGKLRLDDPVQALAADAAAARTMR